MLDIDKTYADLLNSTPYIQSVARNNARIVGVSDYTYPLQLGNSGVGLANALLSGATLRKTLTMQGDSDFVIDTLTAFAIAATAQNVFAVFGRNLTLQIQEMKTGKFFFSKPALCPMVSGAAGMPFVFFAPRVLEPNTSLQITVFNRDQNDYQGFHIAFQGKKIFYA